MIEIVAEINTGHGGSLEKAYEAVKLAKGCGADVIKFQSWAPESLYPSSYLSANRIARKMFQKLKLGVEELGRISEYCREIEIGFSSTPYTVAELEELLDLGPAFIKIASMDIDNHELLARAGSSGIPIVISTGMANLREIQLAVDLVGHERTTLLHCVSNYPTNDEQLKLGTLPLLRSMFPQLKIGFSDHSTHVWTGAAAVAFGARILEKHFTLDKGQLGFDNSMALDVNEFSEYVAISRATSRQIERIDFDNRPDAESALAMRRSAHTGRAVRAGDEVTETDLVFLRPGNGYRRSAIGNILGRRWARDLDAGVMVDEAHVEGQ